MKTLDSYLKYERAIPLSIDELEGMVARPGLKFVDWEKFKGTTIKDLMGKHRGVVLLLDHRGKDMGHYVLFHHLADRELEYFDSYGLAPQRLAAILQYGPKDTARFLNLVKHATKHYTRLQARREDINTCGRYAVMRYNLGWASFDQFRAMMHHDRLHTDDVVTLLTMSTNLAHWEKH